MKKLNKIISLLIVMSLLILSAVQVFAAGNPVFVTTELPEGTVGQKYSATINVSSPSAVEISQWFYADSQDLPPGLTFKDNGDGTAVISGTPKKTGTWPVSFVASNELGEEYQKFYIKITEKIEAPVITTKSLPAALTNFYYEETVKTTGGGEMSMALYMGEGFYELPDGLTFKNNWDGTGTISGIPTKTGSWSFYISASNEESWTKQKLTIKVEDPYVKFDTKTTLPDATVGENYSVKIKASSNLGSPKVVKFTETTLPAGLKFKEGYDSATISGTPTKAGTYKMELAAYYSEYMVKTKFTIVISEPVAESPSVVSSPEISSVIVSSPEISSEISSSAVSSAVSSDIVSSEISSGSETESSVTVTPVIKPAAPKGLSTVALLGICAGAGLLAGLAAALIVILIKKKKNSSEQ